MNEIPPLPHDWFGLIAFLGMLLLQAYNTWQNRQIKEQNSVQIRKQDVAISNQEDMKQQLDGATSAAIATASALGVAQGNLAGAASEQAREATRVGLAGDVAQKLAETEGKS